eukprot:scaffold671312_cov51-Prasinocladus_malaysianus.AAC.1
MTVRCFGHGERCLFPSAGFIALLAICNKQHQYFLHLFLTLAFDCTKDGMERLFVCAQQAFRSGAFENKDNDVEDSEAVGSERLLRPYH